MNPLDNHRQPSPGGNPYGYGGQQDDFSTDFTVPSSSFTDPNSLFNQNFGQGFQSEFHHSNDGTTHQNFQNSLTGHGQYGSLLQMQTDQPTWQNPSYIEAPYSFHNTVGQPSAFSNNPYGRGLSPYGGDVNMNFSFSNRDFNGSSNNQQAPTISPAVIDQSEQTIPPSALSTAEDLWQSQAISQQEIDAGRMQIDKTSTPDLPPQQHQQQQQQQQSQLLTSAQPIAIAAPSAPLKPVHNYDELQNGVPPGSTVNGFHVREATDYKGSAAVTRQLGWIYITNSNFETNESRLASLPEAPSRSSISQLRKRLAQSEAAKEQPAAKAKLEEKLKKREKKGRKKDRTKAPKIVAPAKLVSGVGPRQSVEESDSEDYSDSSEADSGSDYDGDSDHEDEKAPLPEVRPTDPADAVKYDVIEAVWAPSSKRLPPDLLKSRFAPWLENLQKVRKEWKTASDPATKASKKKLFEELIRLTSQHGHYNFIESIDQLPPLANIIAACVTEIVKSEKYDDSLLQAIVLLLLKISVIKYSFVTGTRLNKLAPRIVKNAKGSLKNATQLLVEKMNKSEKATKEAEKKPSESSVLPLKTDESADSKKMLVAARDKAAIDTKKPLSAVTEIKRVASSSPDVKKPLSTVTQKKPGTTIPAKPTVGVISKSQPMTRTVSSDNSAAKTPTVTANGPASKEKERTRYVSTKPPSIFSSISASKRQSPGVAAATKVPVKEQKPVKLETKLIPASAPAPALTPATAPAPAPAPAPTPARPVFSFAETLASIGKPQEEERKKRDTADQKLPETEDERKKRLRKESRRHLRVTWPSDDKLCQIKLFDHGLEDQINQEAAEITDLKDEGRAFKREYRQQHGNVDDFEQDFIKEFDDVMDPEATDFSEIEASQLAVNTTSCANGKKQIESAEAEEQKKRESGVMIAIYPTRQDIPFSPREPIADSWGLQKPQYNFGDPPEWIRNRSANELARMRGQAAPQQHQQQQQGQANVSELLKNISQFSQPQSAQAPPLQQAFGNSASPDIQSILAQLSGPPPPQPQQQQQASMQNNLSNNNDTQAAINLFLNMQNNQQVNAPPAPSMIPQPQASAPAASGAPDLSSILSSLAAMNNQQPQQSQPQQQQQQPQPPAPVAPQQQQAQKQEGSSVDPDILAFLRNYNTPGTPSPASQGQQSNGQPQWPQQGLSLLGNWGQQTQQNSQAPSPASLLGGQWGQQLQQLTAAAAGNGNDRKRGHDDDASNGNGTKKKKAFYGEPKVPCKYWKQGKCHYGDKCTFKHD